MRRALVIGGGPAGLMAAEQLAAGGVQVILAEAKPSFGRKFLMAGKSGLNLTRHEPFAQFAAQYGAAQEWLEPMLAQTAPRDVVDFTEGLGQGVFTGSTGRVFPKVMKASPLLRAWISRLQGQGVAFRARWRWIGWDGGACVFETPGGLQRVRADVTVLACGGASWSRLGSDGAWSAWVPSVPFLPSNVGVRISWSKHMLRHFGAPIKSVVWRAGDAMSRGEAVLSTAGLEGGGIYSVSHALRGGAPLSVDLTPDLSVGELARRYGRKRAKDSWSKWARSALRLSPVKQALLREVAGPVSPQDGPDWADKIKALPLPVAGTLPLDSAISTAGGVPRAALDDHLMLKERPSVFCAGEMLDWDAPTGGYLLTGCFATGRWAGQGALRYLRL